MSDAHGPQQQPDDHSCVLAAPAWVGGGLRAVPPKYVCNDPGGKPPALKVATFASTLWMLHGPASSAGQPWYVLWSEVHGCVQNVGGGLWTGQGIFRAEPWRRSSGADFGSDLNLMRRQLVSL